MFQNFIQRVQELSIMCLILQIKMILSALEIIKFLESLLIRIKKKLISTKSAQDF
jgi:hypothetical protein